VSLQHHSHRAERRQERDDAEREADQVDEPAEEVADPAAAQLDVELGCLLRRLLPRPVFLIIRVDDSSGNQFFIIPPSRRRTEDRATRLFHVGDTKQTGCRCRPL
jgi:hypothetical protein